MNKRQNRFPAAAVPFLLWTVVFVAIPLIYILCMSFLKRAQTWGVVAEFSFDSYARMVTPTYLKVYAQSMWLAVLTTLFTLLIGYPTLFRGCRSGGVRLCCFWWWCRSGPTRLSGSTAG